METLYIDFFYFLRNISFHLRFSKTDIKILLSPMILAPDWGNTVLPKNLMHASQLSWAHICLFCFLRHFICYQNSRCATIHSVGWFLNYTRYCSPYATCMQTAHVSVSVIVESSLSALASFLPFLNPALANMSRAVRVVPFCFLNTIWCKEKLQRGLRDSITQEYVVVFQINFKAFHSSLFIEGQ